MDDFLGVTPTWLIEGVAEYVSLFQIKVGKVRTDIKKEALKQATQYRTIAKKSDFEEIVSLSHREWQAGGKENLNYENFPAGLATGETVPSYYFNSMLLVYYLFEEEKQGLSKHLTRYMLAKMAHSKRAFDKLGKLEEKMAEYQTKFTTYQTEIKEFLKNPEVQTITNSDGSTSFSYPEELTPPSPPEPPEGFDKIQETLNIFGHNDLLTRPDQTMQDLLNGAREYLITEELLPR